MKTYTAMIADVNLELFAYWLGLDRRQIWSRGVELENGETVPFEVEGDMHSLGLVGAKQAVALRELQYTVENVSVFNLETGHWKQANLERLCEIEVLERHVNKLQVRIHDMSRGAEASLPFRKWLQDEYGAEVLDIDNGDSDSEHSGRSFRPDTLARYTLAHWAHKKHGLAQAEAVRKIGADYSGYMMARDSELLFNEDDDEMRFFLNSRTMEQAWQDETDRKAI